MTEITPCHACSCHEVLGVATATGGTTTSAFGVDVTIPLNATNASSCAVYDPEHLNATSSHGARCIPEALALVDGADLVVLVLGIDGSIEHENVDRLDTGPPGLQAAFGAQVLAKGKPVVLVMAGRGILAIDDTALLGGCAAIVEAFAPGHTAMALAETLFGLHNRWGKMPVTVYPHAYIAEQPMTNYAMAKPPGRTYKYHLHVMRAMAIETLD